MLCQKCQKRVASVHFTQIVNNKRTEMYLCPVCAKGKEQLIVIPSFSIEDFFSGLIGVGNSKLYASNASPQKVVCEKCGMSYYEFKSGGRLGCDNCYNTYSEKLKPLLKRLHGNLEHTGKLPGSISKSINTSREIGKLKEQLNKAIQNEEYEKAAEVRDKIRSFESNIEKG
jgi:protein arginine kinase activator